MVSPFLGELRPLDAPAQTALSCLRQFTLKGLNNPKPPQSVTGKPVPCATQKLAAARKLAFFDTQSKNTQTVLAVFAANFFRCSATSKGIQGATFELCNL